MGRICRSYRSAKSVAWMRLKVVGVSNWRFFPFRVDSFTRSLEFHSVKKTLQPNPANH
jgi:hypothetical protein